MPASNESASHASHPVPATPRARLIALDWGTSNLRATLLGEGGVPLQTRAAPVGVMAVPERRFEATLFELVGDWIDAHDCPLIASGMIGSRQGWVEAPYLDCPATLASAASQLVRVPLSRGQPLHVVPGLRTMGRAGAYDVMRGEETQLWGAALPPGATCILPGTHAKWATVGEAGGITGFRTYMTGELYGLLTQHGILGRLMVFGHPSPSHFDAGVRLGLAEYRQATHILFAVRTAGLMGQVPAQGLPDYLSGLLLGIEIGSARDAGGAPATPVVILGDATLVERYARALGMAGIEACSAPADATIRGQWLAACAAGLVGA